MNRSAPRWLRRTAVLTSVSFLWTALFATPLQVAAQVPQKPAFGPPRSIPAPAVHDDPAWHTIDYHAQEHARPAVARRAMPAPLTLLDEVGRLSQPIEANKVAEWKRQLHRPRLLPAAQTAKLHLWLGEYLLAHDEQPEAAQWHFTQAQKASQRTQAVYGVAAYDKGIAAFYEGAYNQALGEFKQVLAARPSLHGFDRSTATLFMRHAGACAGYHGERAAAGIPEPPKLDPLCGAAAVAIALKTAGKPYDKKTVLANLHVTGRGSSLQDVVNGARKLGFAAHVVSAGDKGLIALPKPLVAYVEHDHFISVLDADKHGVTYMCSDCGAWPGGKVHLTWQQWHKLEATHYAVLTTPGSDTDEVLSLLQRTRDQGTQGVQLASLSPKLSGDMVKQTRLLKRLQTVGFPWPIGGLTIVCGFGPGSQHCPDPVQCPSDCGGGSGGSQPGGGSDCNSGPSVGDPVNLATGEEEYKPIADLSVYNPIGPSVTMRRLYNSLRGYGSPTGYQNNDLGQAWSHPYNLCVVQTTGAQPAGGAQSGAPQGTIGGNGLGGYILEPNGARLTFTLSALPTASVPSVSCPLQSGVPMLMTCNYNSATGGSYFVITLPDRTKLITQGKYTNTPCTSPWYPLGQMVDRNGNAITFNYAQTAGNYPLLTTIVDKNGTALLTFNRATNGTGNLTSVADRYGRSVYYHVGTYATTNVPQGLPQSQQELDHVSQVVLTGTASPPDRYAYGYQNVGNGEGTETVPMLHTLTVPSPTGTGTATATINYSANATIASLVDANGNSRSYTQTDANHTTVTIKDALNNVVASYKAGYDMNMSMTGFTNGTNTNYLLTNAYADPNDPYKTSSVTDANTHVTQYTWDRYGNLQTLTTARGTQITNTWDYNVFALGRQISSQEGTKTPTTYAYFEPSGLLQSITQAAPGHSGDNVTVTSSHTYDSLGNELTGTSPGNNAIANITTTNNYTTDGTYTQSAAIGQPLTITNSLSKVMHRRYDSQGNLTVVKDPYGNETDILYNIANQILQVTIPATSQTGSGRCVKTYGYLYPGGPLTTTSQYNENGNLVRQVSYTFDKENKMLSRAGSVEAVSYTYDAAYRRKSVRDSNGGTTTYTYNTAGYLSGVSYPGHSGITDTVQFTSYNAVGQLLKRIDGNGVETDYLRNDPENLLTDIQYPATPAKNVHFTYDAYGRRATMTDATGAVAYAYDDMGASNSITTTYTGLPAQTVSYAYYPDGSRLTMSAPGGSTSYAYDAAGHMTSLSGPAGTASWTYLDNDWLWTQTTAGATTTYNYNALGLLTGLINKGGANYGNGTTLSNYTNLHYDGVMNNTSLTASVPTTAAYSGTTTFAFDNQNQLTQEQSTRSGTYTHGFAYDAAQNPTTFKGVANTYNADNQNTAYTYDGNGNPTLYRGTSMGYDAENRATTFGTLLTAGYNGDGLRASKQTAAGTTYFLYDGETPIVELSAAGAVTAVNTFGANGLLTRQTSGGTTYYTFDPHGNVAQRLNSGQVVSCMFDAHGMGQSSNGTVDPFGYKATSGYYTDTETGLLMLTHRYYDPATGRFLTRDPIGYQGGTNLYGYVNNRPTNLLDKQGTFPAILLPCVACAVCIGFLLYACPLLDDCQNWASCALSWVSNLPTWAKWVCGVSCVACIITLLTGLIGCGASYTQSLVSDQQPQSLRGGDDGNIGPCKEACTLMDIADFCGKTYCVYRCTRTGDERSRWVWLPADRNGWCREFL